ncbi:MULTISPECIES: hypothetical protein [unclassified Streptomyces]|uniref:hypothetical protein n=1 Tax=unclassified Streptomyces TaxID=2593676 RepID=UPI003800E9F5
MLMNLTGTATTAPVGAGTLARVQAATWVEDTTAGPVAHMVLVHPLPRALVESEVTIARDMNALADALTLPAAGPNVRIRDAGPRLTLRDRTPRLTLDGTSYSYVGAPVSPEWRDAVTAGTPVCLSVALAALPPGSPHAAVSRFFDVCLLSGHLRMGTVALKHT